MIKIIYDNSEETKIREIARLREKALHDEASALKHAGEEGIKIGIAEGIAEGRAEERANTIKKMKELGFTSEQIKAIFSDHV